MQQTAIERAVLKAGGQTALAEAIDVSQGLVWQWLEGQTRVHPRHFGRIEKHTGITAHELLADELASYSKSRSRQSGRRASAA